MEMVREVERDLFEMGIRVHPDTMQDKVVKDNPDFDTLEVQAYCYTLTKWDQLGLERMIEYLGGNIQWAMAEGLDRLREEYINPGWNWVIAKDLWKPFLRDEKFAYTYNERFREQIHQVTRELRLRPNSRQIIMTMYDRHQDINNWGGRDRIPCSMYYQFYIRDNKLNMIYTMRSCDFLTHFVHDVYLAIYLLTSIGKMIGIEPGNFVHFMGSLHAYDKDLKKRGIF
jgi:thymidylate synthase